ncbi:hypothetical protein COO60DRAFT_9736 [Scenedesmus sp. NREL 46B-D3]|nr:hypothetical protein COO60DRAFT_9736 [Scenedesmus sp. NREL 46B-D3]
MAAHKVPGMALIFLVAAALSASPGALPMSAGVCCAQRLSAHTQVLVSIRVACSAACDCIDIISSMCAAHRNMH